jgi:hypothetical protein
MKGTMVCIASDQLTSIACNSDADRDGKSDQKYSGIENLAKGLCGT